VFSYAGEQCCPEKKEANEASIKHKKPFAIIEDKIEELFEEITLLNLINGLNLTEEQIKQIIQYNNEVQLLREQIEEVNNKTIQKVIDAFSKLKSALEKNEGIPKDIERYAAMMDQENKEIKEGMMNSVAAIEKELTTILLEGQIEVINTFEPCLIPPKNLKDPVRAGQAQDSEQGLNLLRRVRKIPQEIFDQDKYEIVERHLEMVQKHTGKLTNEERKTEAERLLKVMEQARAMSDKEFELNGPDLARQFMTESKKTCKKDKELREELERIHQTRRGGPTRIGRYLLNPRILPILGKRLEMMKNPKTSEPKDLDKAQPK
jgi:hypothetical protein